MTDSNEEDAFILDLFSFAAAPAVGGGVGAAVDGGFVGGGVGDWVGTLPPDEGLEPRGPRMRKRARLHALELRVYSVIVGVTLCPFIDSFLSLKKTCSTSLLGGNQVDDLPPASSIGADWF